ncbi:MAG TPA: dephospho-CoA kinase [Flavobacterium sp.]|jgi:dephospho-CoA kinase
MTKIIGLTGGIGSGKTTVANLFMAAGVPVYIADEEAKKMFSKPNIRNQITKAFGQETFNDGVLNRHLLAGIVFNDPEKLKILNSIIHPAVREDFAQWLLSNQNAPFVIKEAAILFESGSYVDCDAVITVVAPVEDRIKRVIERDKTTREHVLDRMGSQWTDEMKVAKSQFVIKNTDFNSLSAQVDEILKKVKNI